MSGPCAHTHPIPKVCLPDLKARSVVVLLCSLKKSCLRKSREKPPPGMSSLSLELFALAVLQPYPQLVMYAIDHTLNWLLGLTLNLPHLYRLAWWLLDPGWPRLLSSDLPCSSGLATTMGACWEAHCPCSMVPPSAPAPLPSQSSPLLTHSSAIVFCKLPIGIRRVYGCASPQKLCPLEPQAWICGVHPLFYLDQVSPSNTQHWEDGIAGLWIIQPLILC